METYYRVTIEGWTASFRYPTFVSGMQPTLPVPPLSTLFGLLSAAKGDYVDTSSQEFGFIFQSAGKATDLETYYELSKNLRAKSNINQREFLIEPKLIFYTQSDEVAGWLETPYYPLLLGRSTELAQITAIRAVQLERKASVRLGHTILPFPFEGIYGVVQALPVSFSETTPREAQGVRPFYLIDNFQQYSGDPVLYDPEMNWGIWWWKNF